MDEEAVKKLIEWVEQRGIIIMMSPRDRDKWKELVKCVGISE